MGMGDRNRITNFFNFNRFWESQLIEIRVKRNSVNILADANASNWLKEAVLSINKNNAIDYLTDIVLLIEVIEEELELENGTK